ncbi:PIN domain-containing protein [Cryocola sp. 340MFSha3.1]|uniref:PIN domain-containing protein n=1 Tax=Cryocola sp. 340MFSha3.1 TaxID=1169145 RepID=UPI000379C11E|nr:PIN domain-containing protein [Cryocola sp. 340MFSha3.1]
MIVLDTNVVSELIQPWPNPRVISWIDSRLDSELFITTVTVAEMLTGANRMGDGFRAEDRANLILGVLDHFRPRTLPFGVLAATECANITSLRFAAGRPIALADAMIAATAVAAEADAVATRDKDFADVGVPVIDPWAA